MQVEELSSGVYVRRPKARSVTPWHWSHALTLLTLLGNVHTPCQNELKAELQNARGTPYASPDCSCDVQFETVLQRDTRHSANTFGCNSSNAVGNNGTIPIELCWAVLTCFSQIIPQQRQADLLPTQCQLGEGNGSMIATQATLCLWQHSGQQHWKHTEPEPNRFPSSDMNSTYQYMAVQLSI